MKGMGVDSTTTNVSAARAAAAPPSSSFIRPAIAPTVAASYGGFARKAWYHTWLKMGGLPGSLRGGQPHLWCV